MGSMASMCLRESGHKVRAPGTRVSGYNLPRAPLREAAFDVRLTIPSETERVSPREGPDRGK